MVTNISAKLVFSYLRFFLEVFLLKASYRAAKRWLALSMEIGKKSGIV